MRETVVMTNKDNRVSCIVYYKSTYKMNTEFGKRGQEWKVGGGSPQYTPSHNHKTLQPQD